MICNIICVVIDIVVYNIFQCVIESIRIVNKDESIKTALIFFFLSAKHIMLNRHIKIILYLFCEQQVMWIR